MDTMIRPLASDDVPFLWTALYHAIFVPPGGEPPDPALVHRPELAQYVEGFGERPGDTGVLAERDGQPIGAAWVRLIHGYGYVDASTPELALAVLPEFRGQGVGTLLLERLIRSMRGRFSGISLSVDLRNPAYHLYTRLNFETQTVSRGTVIMLKTL